MTNTEIDAAVHAKVLGITWDESRCRVCGWTLDPEGIMCRADNCSMRPRPTPRADAIPAYSSDIGLAWRVVEAMRERGFWLKLESSFWGPSDGPDEWEASFEPHESTGIAKFCGEGATAPLAISLAALRLVRRLKREERNGVPIHRGAVL